MEDRFHAALKIVFMKIFSKRILILQMVAAVMALTAISCGNDDDDISAPQIQITNPSDNDRIVPGTGDLIVEGTLSDDGALDFCTISIEYTDTQTSAVAMGDDRMKSTTGGGNGTVTGIDDEPWSPDSARIALSGKTYEFKTDYKPFGSVPSNIKFGEYTLTIEVEDEAGNVAKEEIVLDLSLE